MRHPFWESYCLEFERVEIRTWDFGKLPQYVGIGSVHQLFPIPAMRVLHCEEDSINIRVFLSFDAANISHSKGIIALLEKSLTNELAWEIRQLKLADEKIHRFRRIVNKEELHGIVAQLFIQSVLALPKDIPHDEMSFSIYRQNALIKINELPPKLINLFSEVSEEFEKCTMQIEKIKRKDQTAVFYKGIIQDIEGVLIGYMNIFFSSYGLTNFKFQLPRYLKALWWRIETGYVNPGRYIKCVNKINAYQKQLINLQSLPLKRNYPDKTELSDLSEMIEEWIISLFAQQKVKTILSVSEEKIQERIELLKQKGHLYNEY